MKLTHVAALLCSVVVFSSLTQANADVGKPPPAMTYLEVPYTITLTTEPPFLPNPPIDQQMDMDVRDALANNPGYVLAPITPNPYLSNENPPRIIVVLATTPDNSGMGD